MKILKIYFLTSVLLMIYSTFLIGQPHFDNYHERNDFLMASPGAMKFGLYGYDNPALLNYVKHPDLVFSWSDKGGSFSNFNKWGMFLGMPNIGFGALNHSFDDGRITDYRISSAFGNKSFGTGFSYNWTKGATELFERKNSVTIGALYRPTRYFSLGLIGTADTDVTDYEGVVDISIRPLGNEKIAVFGDYALRKDMDLYDGYWSAGIAYEAFPGVRLTGRYFNNSSLSFGMEFSLGRTGISTQGNFTDELNHSHNTYSIRIGSYDRNVRDMILKKPKYYATIDLSNQISYQPYKYFDDSHSFIKILDAIDASAEDPRVSGIAINTSGMNINHTLLWELREQLKEFKKSDKKVIIFVENAGMNVYHFASIADIIVLDPQGSINLPGYLMGSIYLSNMLKKIGVGFDEWRLFEYKSGLESLTREKMSDKNREQRQNIVNNRYNLVKRDIMASRGFTNEEYEKHINDIFFFTANEAIEHNLVDKTARWSDVNDIIKYAEGKKKHLLNIDSLKRYQLPADDYWGKKPKLALIYAEGICAMESGIKARSLAKDISKARENPKIEAIVFRIESPGGSVIASDIIAKELKKAKDEKPVIISQGSVAASGGYWISMYGDTIVSTPNTITGSIGVLAGFFYDKGIKEKTGYSTDYVKKGKFADMGFGIKIPFINMPILDETFDEKEEKIIEKLLMNIYDEFVIKVSKSRKKSYDYIDSISKGRTWTGSDAYDLGLVDTLGGLTTAINIALEKSGIGIDGKYNIVEYPEPELFDASSLMLKGINLHTKKTKEDQLIEHLHFRMKHNGKPLLMLPLEYMHYYFNEANHK